MVKKSGYTVYVQVRRSDGRMQVTHSSIGLNGAINTLDYSKRHAKEMKFMFGYTSTHKPLAKESDMPLLSARR